MCYFFKKFVDSRVDLAKLFIVNEGGGGREAGLTSSLVILGISGLTCIICYYNREKLEQINNLKKKVQNINFDSKNLKTK